MVKIDIKKILEVNKISQNKPLSLIFTSINNFNIFPITFMTNKSIPTGCEHSQPMYNYFKLPKDGP